MDNFTYFQICDEYLQELLKPQNKMLFYDEIPATIKPKIINHQVIWTIIFNQLLVDGHIKEAFAKVNGNDLKHYVLTADGRVFIEEGGYNKYFLKKAKEQLTALQIMQSNVDVNKSIIENNKLQRVSIIVTVLIIAVGLATQIQTCNIARDQLKQSNKQTEKVRLLMDTVPIKIINSKNSIDSIKKR